MVEQSIRDDAVVGAPPAALTWRRALFFGLIGLTIAGLTALAALTLSPGGLGVIDIVLIVLFRNDPTVVRDRVLERHHRPRHHAFRAGSRRRGDSSGGTGDR
jgi:hypothetical protein